MLSDCRAPGFAGPPMLIDQKGPSIVCGFASRCSVPLVRDQNALRLFSITKRLILSAKTADVRLSFVLALEAQ